MEVSSRTVFLINLFAAVALISLLSIRFGWL
ncbi:stress response membrane protein YncL [Scandinavium sp. H11S7]|uniref:Stress response membrane protein YncL n=1 Tax=Scandinavium hiltneri TaxID=2926519 RepID=A0ABT2DY13_9ENTR|nr:stress response membrane protein YncL [Scandinavium hiltneri]MCS2158927.1 stress response membrane protein YncL [Scandinavium hiltneri]MCS2160516.1 stress response membrane protein YncL [Scandinavium hiltneri]